MKIYSCKKRHSAGTKQYKLFSHANGASRTNYAAALLVCLCGWSFWGRRKAIVGAQSEFDSGLRVFVFILQRPLHFADDNSCKFTLALRLQCTFVEASGFEPCVMSTSMFKRRYIYVHSGGERSIHVYICTHGQLSPSKCEAHASIWPAQRPFVLATLCANCCA